MKKTLLLAAAIIAGTTALSAQDFTKATELAKTANEALVAGNYEEAIQGFKDALTEASQCTEESAAEFMGTCKTGITQALYSAANHMVKDGDLDGAIDRLNTAIASATEYGVEELKEKAVTLKQQVIKLYANNQIKAAAVATSAEEKIACFNKAIEKLDILINEGFAEAGTYIQKGQVLKSLGKKDDAIAAFEKAKEMGSDLADKQIAKLYLQEASAKLKAKDYAGAVESAKKSLEYEESATAYKVAGTAANGAKDAKAAVEYLSNYLKLAPDAKDAAQIKAAIDALKAQIK